MTVLFTVIQATVIKVDFHLICQIPLYTYDCKWWNSLPSFSIHSRSIIYFVLYSPLFCFLFFSTPFTLFHVFFSLHFPGKNHSLERDRFQGSQIFDQSSKTGLVWCLNEMWKKTFCVLEWCSLMIEPKT